MIDLLINVLYVIAWFGYIACLIIAMVFKHNNKNDDAIWYLGLGILFLLDCCLYK